MGYDRGDSFPFDFEPNGISFGSKSKGKLSPRSYPNKFERKWKYSFLRRMIKKCAALPRILREFVIESVELSNCTNCEHDRDRNIKLVRCRVPTRNN